MINFKNKNILITGATGVPLVEKSSMIKIITKKRIGIKKIFLLPLINNQQFCIASPRLRKLVLI